MIYIGIIVLIFGIELLIKNYMEHKWENGTKREILKGKVVLQKFKNKGACFGLFSKRSGFVAIFSVVFSLGILVYFIVSLGTRGNVPLRVGLAFLLGGAFSNTYDRLKRKYVVDYFSFHTKSKKVNAIVFNMADFFVMIGAMLTAIASS